MRKIAAFFIFICCALVVTAQQRLAPAYPLITHDPYFSIWSFSDTLSASPTRHWTGAPQSLIGLAKVDGVVYRFLGANEKVYKTIVPASDEKTYETTYTETKPADGWMNSTYNNKTWKHGLAPFGDNGSMVKTKWQSKDLWMRRTFTLSNTNFNKLYLKLQHDDDVDVYLNGEEIYQKKGWTNKFIYVPIANGVLKKLKRGQNILAIHVQNTAGGAWLDAGLVEEPKDIPDRGIQLAVQKGLTLNATQTIYQFACGKTDLT